MISSNDILENIDYYIKFIISMYEKDYEIPVELKYNIQIVDSIEDSVKDFMNRTNREYETDEIDYNGTTCVPNTIDEITEIFISKDLIIDCNKNIYQFICTIIHELTHAIDFYNFARKYFDGNYNNMIFNSDPYGFKMWTEFNAKRKSYLMYSRFLISCFKDNNIPYNKPIDYELGFQNDIITKSITSNSHNIAVYDIMQYLGRYSCWELDYYEDFSNGKLFPKIFKEKLEPIISDLYTKLKQNNDSMEYYNELARLVRLLIGKIALIE